MLRCDLLDMIPLLEHFSDDDTSDSYGYLAELYPHFLDNILEACLKGNSAGSCTSSVIASSESVELI